MHSPSVIVLGLLSAMSALAWAGPSDDASGHPGSPSTPTVAAYWAEHNEIDELDRLPHPYQCDDLYYKYRDVLLRVGARPGMKIYTYGCIRQGKMTGDTPHVDLTYATPREMPDPRSPAELQARRATVHLAPGEPKSLKPDDCALLDAMRQTVLASIAGGMDAQALPCDDRRASRHYGLDVPALLPVPDSTASASG